MFEPELVNIEMTKKYLDVFKSQKSRHYIEHLSRWIYDVDVTFPAFVENVHGKVQTIEILDRHLYVLGIDVIKLKINSKI